MIYQLQENLRESQEEYIRAVMRADMEEQERMSLEVRNTELNSKLMETRNTLKETQNSLQNIQLATEQLVNKREQREQQIQHLINENNSFVSKIATLESRLKDAEEAVLESNSRRDDFIHKLQDQLGSYQEEIFHLQSEITSINGQKLIVENELDGNKQKLTNIEQRIRGNESNIEITYKTKLQNLEEKNKALQEKLSGPLSLLTCPFIHSSPSVVLTPDHSVSSSSFDLSLLSFLSLPLTLPLCIVLCCVLCPSLCAQERNISRTKSIILKNN
jgi:chromosome segregation ATPase